METLEQAVNREDEGAKEEGKKADASAIPSLTACIHSCDFQTWSYVTSCYECNSILSQTMRGGKSLAVAIPEAAQGIQCTKTAASIYEYGGMFPE